MFFLTFLVVCVSTALRICNCFQEVVRDCCSMHRTFFCGFSVASAVNRYADFCVMFFLTFLVVCVSTALRICNCFQEVVRDCCSMHRTFFCGFSVALVVNRHADFCVMFSSRFLSLFLPR